MSSIERLKAYDESLVDSLMAIERASFPKAFNSREDYIELLENPDNINLLLKSDGVICGYLCARPHNDAVAELKVYDQDLEFDDGRYYIDMIEILPEYRHRGDAFNLLASLAYHLSYMCEQGGSINVSMHIRATYGFGRTVRKMFSEASYIRSVENWMGNGEIFDYIEINSIIGGKAWKMMMKVYELHK